MIRHTATYPSRISKERAVSARFLLEHDPDAKERVSAKQIRAFRCSATDTSRPAWRSRHHQHIEHDDRRQAEDH